MPLRRVAARPVRDSAPLGAGGMGEVYRARDTRLDRTVAIKVLPPGFAEDEERASASSARRKTISSLNHPHICTLYDVGREGETDYLVMEHLEGETLADRLAQGPAAARPGAALRRRRSPTRSTRAHRQGIVHRDLKPGNVMLTKSGAKLLDFGLARCQPAVGALRASSRLATQPHGEPAADRRRARSSARSSTWRPSSSRAGRPTRGPTSSRSARCSTRWRPGGGRSRGRAQASLIAAILSDAAAADLVGRPMTRRRRSTTSSRPASRRIPTSAGRAPHDVASAAALDRRAQARRPECPRRVAAPPQPGAAGLGTRRAAGCRERGPPGSSRTATPGRAGAWLARHVEPPAENTLSRSASSAWPCLRTGGSSRSSRRGRRHKKLWVRVSTR